MFNIHSSIFDEYGESDERRTEQYVDGLIEEFARSPEGVSFQEKYGDLGWARAMLEYGIDYIGATPTEMSVSEFNEVLFDLFPQKVSVEAEHAGEIVDEIRAFWQFIDRAYALDNAPAILGVLNNDATRKLRKKLDDPSTFGLAKSIVMLGKKAGYDMSTEEGMAEFMTVFNARLESGDAPDLPLGPLPGIGLDDLPQPHDRPTGDALKKKRKERKRQRDAKKRNRKR
jgi:hypothetical protein